MKSVNRPGQLKIDLNIGAELRTLKEAVQSAERAGFDGVTISETGRDAFLACALACEHSSSLSVTTEVAVAFPRSPMITAMDAWELQKFSNGRFVLGLGTQVKGHITRRFSSPWDKPSAQMREYVGALRSILSAFRGEGPLRFSGKYYNFSLLTDEFNPKGSSRPLPIHLAAVNPLNASLAGEICDGIRVHRFHTLRYIQEILAPAVAAGTEVVRAQGVQRTAPEWCAMVIVATGDSASQIAKAREEARRSVAFYGSTRTYSNVFAFEGRRDLVGRLHELSLAQDWEAMTRLIDDDLLDRIIISAPYEELAERLCERYVGLFQRLSVRVADDSPETVENWSRVLQELHSRG